MSIDSHLVPFPSDKTPILSPLEFGELQEVLSSRKAVFFNLIVPPLYSESLRGLRLS